MTGSQPGGAVPPASNQARATAPVVFIPLGYGPAVAARIARLALLRSPASGPRETRRPTRTLRCCTTGFDDEEGPLMTSPTPGAGVEPTATPIPRLGWRMQAVLDLLVEDPAREVWPYWIDQRTPTRGDGYQVLKRLAEAGWLTSRREDRPNGSGRVLYRLTPSGEELAREAVARPVRWPAGVPRGPRQPPEPPGE